MGWESPSRWLAAARTLQVVAALASTILHGFTTAWIQVKKLGLTQHMVVLELLIVIVAVYTTVAILVQYCGWRSVKKPGLIAFVIFDLIICALLLGIISMLARSGLPVSCAGLTISDYQPGYDQSSLYAAPARRASESGHLQGEMNNLCGLERTYFGFANFLVFAYIATIVLNIIRLFELKYITLGNPSREDEVINLKTIKDLEQPSPISSTARVNIPPPAPASEGIISRTPSLRSTTTASTSRPAYTAVPTRTNSCAISRRPVGGGGSMSSPSRRPGPDGFNRVSLDEDSDNAEAALVSDGIRHQQRQPPLRDYSHHHQQQHPSPHSHHHRMPSLLEEDQMTTTSDLEHALVSDGMRPSAPMLPPYEPGNRRMSIGG